MWGDGDTPSSNHERWGNHWMAWSYWIFVLEDAARMIGEQSHHHVAEDGAVVMPAVLAVQAMLLGYAIECALKCSWIKQGNKMVKSSKFIGVPGAGADHNLLQLGKIVGFKPTPRKSDVLTLLPKFIRFAGRYPIRAMAEQSQKSLHPRDRMTREQIERQHSAVPGEGHCSSMAMVRKRR